MSQAWSLHAEIDCSPSSSVQMNHHQAAPTDSVPDGQQDAGRECRRHRSVNRIPALLQYLNTYFGRVPMLRHNHA